MYSWYAWSKVCCIFLEDVPELPASGDLTHWKRQFKKCRWLTRGWTLQEMLAKSERHFFSKEWELIENDPSRQFSLVQEIYKQTNIPVSALTQFYTWEWSIAQKMSWASKRNTTRPEDRAYSLLGLFDVHIPLIYGEGPKAFQRLQEEIIRTSEDQTIFCWKCSLQWSGYTTWRGLLAESPEEFTASGNYIQSQYSLSPNQPIQLTNMGFQMRLQLESAEKLQPDTATGPLEFYASLDCSRRDRQVLCGIWVLKTHEDHYVRINPGEIPEVALSNGVEQIMSSWDLAFVYIKSHLRGLKLRKVDKCSRIEGLEAKVRKISSEIFPLIKLVTSDVSVVSVVLPTFFLFKFWDTDGAHERNITRWRIELNSTCFVEISVRYDRTKSYNRGYEDQADPLSPYKWRSSQCCDWRIERSNCDHYKISLLSYITTGAPYATDDAVLMVEFIDESIHSVEREDEEMTSEDGSDQFKHAGESGEISLSEEERGGFQSVETEPILITEEEPERQVIYSWYTDTGAR
jgi:hypothetical protein